MVLHEKFGSGNADSNPALKPNDVILTPRHIAEQMIGFYDLNEQSTILDPCRGGGAFYDQFPCMKKEWCEITEGRDFFTWSKKVDWIITNPPYSIFTEFLEKCFEVADNVALLIPMSKLVSSLSRVNMVMEYGGIVSMRIIGASKCGFPFGFPAAAVEMRRGFKGETRIELWPTNSD